MLQFSLAGLLHTHCQSFPKTKIFLLYTVSDLGRTIVGLLQFEQRCPLQVSVLGHSGALQNCVSKKKETRKRNFSSYKIRG